MKNKPYTPQPEKVNSPNPCDPDRKVPPSSLAETSAAYTTADRRVYTIEDIYALPDGVRAELIDGHLYYMATPTRTHQKVAGEMHLAVANYIRSKGGKCEVYIPPFAVFLFGDDSTYVEPDLVVVCDTKKLEERGCVGAPDWVVEVLSPSSSSMDRLLKLNKYRDAGVREYWIIDPSRRIVQVYIFHPGENAAEEEYGEALVYSFDDPIPCSLFPELKIRLSDHV